MQKNIGARDRILRFIFGGSLLFVGWFLIENIFLRAAFLFFGAVGVIGSLVGYCGLYQMLHLNTLKSIKHPLYFLSWFAFLCGLTAYLIGWAGLLQEKTILFPMEFWFYDAIAAGIFGLFFLKVYMLEGSRK